jgi:hypothetical protein
VSRPRAAEIAARAVAILAPIGCAAYAIANAHSVFLGGAAWLVVLATSIAGYGHAAERALRLEVDVGLRMAWGAGVYLAVAGVGLAAGVLTHVVLAVLVGLGFVGYVVRQITTERPPLVAAVRGLADLRRRSLTATLLFALVGAIALFNVAGGIAKVSGNTYDDDIAYTAFIKRTLDIGDIDEPFSFRRISAFGGQTALGALAPVRGTLANIYLVDAALFQAILLLLVLGLAFPARAAASRDGPTELVIVGLLLVVLVLLPNTSINTASHWTGAVLFLAMYRTATLAARPDLAPRAAIGLFAMLGALSAGACTLRQNYLPVGLLFPALVLVIRLGREPRKAFRAERSRWLATLAGGAVALLPYCIASYRSNATFLYPFWTGTFNPDIQMQPTLFSAWQELQFFLRVLIEPDPIRVWLVLLPVLFLAKDTRAGKPLTAMTIASVIGFALLVHSFPMSDARNLWRYGFGFQLTLFIALVVEGGAAGMRRTPDTAVQTPLLARVVLVAALVVQVAMSGRGMTNKYAGIASDLDFARSTDRHGARALEIERTYAELQLAVPAGATVAILLDEPFYLDYRRNPIINLDTPGFASFAPGMPTFHGPEPVGAYFLAHGVRYLAFVRGDHSRYFYRRDLWVKRTLIDTELWRILGAYLVDSVDNFTALAATRAVLFEQNGMVVLDLAVPK